MQQCMVIVNVYLAGIHHSAFVGYAGVHTPRSCGSIAWEAAIADESSTM